MRPSTCRNELLGEEILDGRENRTPARLFFGAHDFLGLGIVTALNAQNVFTLHIALAVRATAIRFAFVGTNFVEKSRDVGAHRYDAVLEDARRRWVLKNRRLRRWWFGLLWCWNGNWSVALGAFRRSPSGFGFGLQRFATTAFEND